jgi:hypothetical protein
MEGSSRSSLLFARNCAWTIWSPKCSVSLMIILSGLWRNDSNEVHLSNIGCMKWLPASFISCPSKCSSRVSIPEPWHCRRRKESKYLRNLRLAGTVRFQNHQLIAFQWHGHLLVAPIVGEMKCGQLPGVRNRRVRRRCAHITYSRRSCAHVSCVRHSCAQVAYATRRCG